MVNNKFNIVSAQCNEPLSFLRDFFSWDVGEVFYDVFLELLETQNYWVKIKNKEVFFSHRVQGLIPDLSKFTPSHSLTLQPRPRHLKHSFAGYTGEIMSRDDFSFGFSVDYYDYLIKNFAFKDFGYFTINEDYFVDKHCTYAHDWGSFPVCTSYHIPIFKFNKNPKTTDYSIFSYFQSLMYLVQDGLIPDGLTLEQELIFKFMLVLYEKNPTMFEIDEWNVLIFNETNVTETFLHTLVPYIESYLLEKSMLTPYNVENNALFPHFHHKNTLNSH